MIDKLQTFYNLLIHKSNIQYAMATSPDKHFDGLREGFESSAWAFQEAAALLKNDFPELIYRETNREKEIRQHHMQEESTEAPKEKIEQ